MGNHAVVGRDCVRRSFARSVSGLQNEEAKPPDGGIRRMREQPDKRSPGVWGNPS
ncbi:hypothetical protein AZA_38646 [Nitrospirillum viridazoti Y2]|nr:hypothetical protein AZA_38646 [Nitrospirillum amazonense Y2]